jgi:hypothetical protein
LKIETELLFGRFHRVDGIDGGFKVFAGFFGRLVLAAWTVERLKISNIDNEGMFAIHAFKQQISFLNHDAFLFPIVA